VRISWDEALGTIAEKFGAIAADDPRAILPYSYGGTLGFVQGSSMDLRFFHRLGASLLDRTICSAAGTAGWKATVGASIGTDPEAIVDAKLILIWGANPVVSNLHGWRYIRRRSGAARSSSASTRGAARPPRSATSTSHRGRAPTARSRSR